MSTCQGLKWSTCGLPRGLMKENTKKRLLVLLKCKTTFLPPKGLNFIWGLSLRPENNTAGIPYALNCCQQSQAREEILIVAESCNIHYRTVNFAGSAGTIQDDLEGEPYINGKLWMSTFQRSLRFVISPFLERVMAVWMQTGQDTREVAMCFFQCVSWPCSELSFTGGGHTNNSFTGGAY